MQNIMENIKSQLSRMNNVLTKYSKLLQCWVRIKAQLLIHHEVIENKEEKGFINRLLGLMNEMEKEHKFDDL